MTSSNTSNQSGRRNPADSQNASEGKRGRRSRASLSHLAGETRALWEDMREWVDLRVELVQVDIEERIQKAANEIMAVLLAAVLGLFAMAFLLHGISVWLGRLLGATEWGYVLVGLVLAIAALIVRRVKPDLARGIRLRGTGSTKTLDAASISSISPGQDNPEPRSSAPSKERGGNRDNHG